jgi:hypothetical protein
MKRMNFPNRKTARRVDAEARQAEYDRIPFSVKLEKAGSKERAKLENRKEG